MPIRTRTMQLNEAMDFFTKYLAEMNLMKQRQKGYMELEETGHQNVLEQIKERVFGEISKDPIIDRDSELLFYKQLHGEDISKDLERVEKRGFELMSSAVKAASGKPLEEKDVFLLGKFSEGFRENIVNRIAERSMQEREITGVTEPTLKVRGYEAETARIGVGIRGEEATTERLKLFKETSDEQYKRWQPMIKDTIDFLESEGVKGDPMNVDTRALFSSGKITDPLSSENRGKAFTYLSQLWVKLNQGESLSKNEINFLVNVRDTSKIEKEGLPSPTTGLTPTGEAEAGAGIENAIRTRMLGIITQMYMEEGKLKQEDALIYAKRFLGLIK